MLELKIVAQKVTKAFWAVRVTNHNVAEKVENIWATLKRKIIAKNFIKSGHTE